MSDEALLHAVGLVPAALAGVLPLDLTLSGGLVVLVGPGREQISTWLYALAGLEPLAAGRLQLLGRPASEVDAVQRREFWHQLGFVTPQAPLLSIISGLRNVMLPALYHRLAPEAEAERRACALLGEIAYDADHYVLPAFMGELQRRHLLIARALMLEPRVLMLEQPLDGLDVPVADLLRDYIVGKVRPRVNLLVVAANDALLAQRADVVLFVGRQGVRRFAHWAELLACPADEVQHYLQYERRACAALGGA